MELIINGEIIELGDSSPAITKKSIDIDNPSARFVDYTNKFKLPDTVKNRELFQSPKAIGSNNRSYDKLYDAVLSDVFQIFRGSGFLDNSTKDKLSFQIIDESKELFKSLEIKLKELDWSDLDTILTQAAIDAQDTADPDNCWVWGKACYHEKALQINTDQTTGDDRCKYSRPSFYVQGLLKRAIEYFGYSYSASELDLAFSSNHKDFFFTSYQKTIDADFSPSGTLALTGLNTNDFAHADLTVLSGSISIGTKNTIFRVKGSITSDADVDFIIRAIDDVDGTKITESKLSIVAGTQEVDFSTSEFQSDNGYTIDIRFEGTGSVSFDDVLIYTILSDKNEDLSTNPWLGYWIKVYDNLPDLTYKDLFHLVCVTANQFNNVDSYVKSFQWGSLAKLSKLNAVDWSDKFVIGSENITAQFQKLSQRNLLKYENDLTVNPELGWSSFLSDNESFAEESDYIILKFGASNDVTIDNNDISHLKVYSDTTRIIDQEIMIRLFAIEGSRLVFSPISWENIAANYYENWFNSLYRIRQINANFNLSKLDVLKWHEKQLVYIDYFKTTFIVLEISNFIPKKLTKVKLLAYGR